MYAIKNTKTNRLLRVEAEKEEYGDWAYNGYDETYSSYYRTYLSLFNSENDGVIFVTTLMSEIEELIKTGKYYDDIRIDDFDKIKDNLKIIQLTEISHANSNDNQTS